MLWGADIGQANVSASTMGVMGYRTPHIDRLAKEGMIVTDDYAEQGCTAGRSTFITGPCTLRTGLSKVGLPGADAGLRKEFFYFNDDGGRVTLRYENWRLVFAEQKTVGTMRIWMEPFTNLRIPLIFDLRADPSRAPKSPRTPTPTGCSTTPSRSCRHRPTRASSWRRSGGSRPGSRGVQPRGRDQDAAGGLGEQAALRSPFRRRCRGRAVSDHVAQASGAGQGRVRRSCPRNADPRLREPRGHRPGSSGQGLSDPVQTPPTLVGQIEVWRTQDQLPLHREQVGRDLQRLGKRLPMWAVATGIPGGRWTLWSPKAMPRTEWPLRGGAEPDPEAQAKEIHLLNRKGEARRLLTDAALMTSKTWTMRFWTLRLYVLLAREEAGRFEDVRKRVADETQDLDLFGRVHF